jgi:hypothetical protein
MENPHLDQATEGPNKLSNDTPGHREPASKSGHRGGNKKSQMAPLAMENPHLNQATEGAKKAPKWHPWQ